MIIRYNSEGTYALAIYNGKENRVIVYDSVKRDTDYENIDRGIRDYIKFERGKQKKESK